MWSCVGGIHDNPLTLRLILVDYTMKYKIPIKAHTFWIGNINEVRCRSEHDLLQDDSEAVDISFLSSIDRSSCHT